MAAAPAVEERVKGAETIRSAALTLVVELDPLHLGREEDPFEARGEDEEAVELDDTLPWNRGREMAEVGGGGGGQPWWWRRRSSGADGWGGKMIPSLIPCWK